MRYAVPRERRSLLFQLLLPPRLSSAIPSVSIGVTLGLVIGISVAAWWRESTPSLTANALLVHAEKWDTASAAASPGVAHQTIQIKTAGRTMKRSIYWDLQGKRRPRHMTLPDTEERLRSSLDRAGVDWDQPISASAYQAWHDQQHVRADQIIRTSAHLLTLTTTVPDGPVSKESLTVRDTDFHPICRMVGFRDSETVEIAEVDFNILPWGVVDAGIFEPIGAVSEAALPAPAQLLAPLHLPLAPSLEQLDETELAARLILNELHADTDEQIDIRRSPHGVEVDGLVETNERKHELSAQLSAVPRLKVVLQSVADLKQKPVSNDEAVRVETASLPDYPSALETYLRARGRNVDEINLLAGQIFSGALTISQESNAIAGLKARFVLTERTPVVASATLQELLFSHHQRLEAALRQERVLLMLAGAKSILPESHRGASAPAAASLTDAAARNMALSKELTQTNAPAARSAEAIFADMSATVECVDAAGREAYRMSQEDSAQSIER